MLTKPKSDRFNKTPDSAKHSWSDGCRKFYKS